MKNYFRLGFTALALTFLFNAFAVTETKAQIGIINDVLKKMDQHYKILTTLQADVVRSKTNVQLGETDVYMGKIVLVPGKGQNLSLRLDWSKPKVETLSVVNGKYVAYIPSAKRAYTGNSNSKTAQDKGGNVLSVMSMSKEQIKAAYDVLYLGQENVSGGIPTWRIKLTPKAKTSFKFAELWVDGNGMPLQGKVIAMNDDTDTILLKNLRKNETIKGAIFKVDFVKGTEIIEG